VVYNFVTKPSFCLYPDSLSPNVFHVSSVEASSCRPHV